MVGQGGLPHTGLPNQSGMERKVIITNHHPGSQNLCDQILLPYPDHIHLVGLGQLDLDSVYDNLFHFVNIPPGLDRGSEFFHL
jgi:hypothetical protein